MYQYAIRLTDSSNQTESVLALLNEAGNSYLAAINALHLSGPQSTWITIPDKGANAEEVKEATVLPTDINKILYGRTQFLI